MKILAVAGASGGHIYPALAFLEGFEAEKSVTNALLVLPSRSIKVDPNFIHCEIEYISSAKLSCSLNRRNIAAFLNFVKGAGESLGILLKFKPDIVVGFGSIDTIPLVMMAWFFRIKTLIHEQNVLPGKANRFLARFVDKVAVSFPESRRYFNLSKDKIVLTGNPIRRSLKKMIREDALSILDLDKDKFTILVMGGSQGSGHINSVFIKAAGLIKEKWRLQVIHLTGREEYEAVKEKYKQLDIQARVFGFLEEMSFVYSAADLVITRAGATTLAELLYFRLAAIIVPYPFAYSHQSLNADFLKKANVALVIDDNSFDENNLKALLEDLLHNFDKIAQMRIGYAQFPEQNYAFSLNDAVLALV